MAILSNQLQDAMDEILFEEYNFKALSRATGEQNAKFHQTDTVQCLCVTLTLIIATTKMSIVI